jgi:hypothetical protein
MYVCIISIIYYYLLRGCSLARWLGCVFAEVVSFYVVEYVRSTVLLFCAGPASGSFGRLLFTSTSHLLYTASIRVVCTKAATVECRGTRGAFRSLSKRGESGWSPSHSTTRT